MPRKSIVSPHKNKPLEPDSGNKIKILFVEDGSSETDRFIDGVKAGFISYKVTSGYEAVEHLSKNPDTDIIYITMEFQSIPENQLVGAGEAVFSRFKDDKKKAMEFLRKNQGAFIIHYIRKQLDKPIPILVSYDFSSELQRWDTLSSRYENVYYCRSGTGAINVSDLIKTIVNKTKP